MSDFTALANLVSAGDQKLRENFLANVAKQFGAGFARHLRGYFDRIDGAALIAANEKQIAADRRRRRNAPKQSRE